jgi:hypothetical protein
LLCVLLQGIGPVAHPRGRGSVLYTVEEASQVCILVGNDLLVCFGRAPTQWTSIGLIEDDVLLTILQRVELAQVEGIVTRGCALRLSGGSRSHDLVIGEATLEVPLALGGVIDWPLLNGLIDLIGLGLSASELVV